MSDTDLDYPYWGLANRHGEWIVAPCDAAGWLKENESEVDKYFGALFARSIHETREDALRTAALVALGGTVQQSVVR